MRTSDGSQLLTIRVKCSLFESGSILVIRLVQSYEKGYDRRRLRLRPPRSTGECDLVAGHAPNTSRHLCTCCLAKSSYGM
jgi:hypothetical protein